MNYVISDIHGQFDKYQQMLRKISLSDNDTLYVLGDVLDRGSAGLKILKDMMLRPNVVPLLGNHEYMASICLSWLMKEVTDETIGNMDTEKLCGLSEWMSVGGDQTITEFRKLDLYDREDIVDYLSEFSLYEVVIANGKEFVLVHAGLDNFTQDRDLYDYDLSELIFHKPDYEKIYFPDKYLVTGHIPTRTVFAAEQGKNLNELKTEEFVDKIFEKNHHIAIDCGCGYGGKLGCICLETMEKIYV